MRILNKISALFVVISIVLTPSANLLAQDGAAGGSEFEAPIKDVATVFAVGAGGAILGLSTLSFVEEPKEHLRNILVGGAIGIILGVGIVAFTQANKSKDAFEGSIKNKSDFDGASRYAWHKATVDQNKVVSKAPLQFNYNLSF